MGRLKEVTSFVTIKKHHALIVQQPVIYYEKYKQGANKGKVKKKRQIQYCEDLDTIFVDEQRKLTDKPEVTPIFITKSILTIDNDNVPYITLMRSHPDNTDNGGALWRELDIEKEEAFEIAQYEALDKARSMLMSADDNLIRTVAIWFLGTSYAYKRINELKKIIRTKLDMNLKMADKQRHFVDVFIDFCEDKNNDEKLMVSMCMDKNLIKIADGKKVVWYDTEEVIFNGSQPHDVIKEFSFWLKNDEEGRTNSKILIEKLENINK